MEKTEKEFARIVREHKTTIYTVCYMFSKDSDEVNDLFQEVLINLWNGMNAFKGESDIKTWIWRVSFNTCISANRKKRRTKTVPLTMSMDLFDEQDESTKQIRMLYSRIQKLEVFDRAIILLWLENLSYDEIGAIVGISARNVGVRLYRIKAKLMEMSND